MKKRGKTTRTTLVMIVMVLTVLALYYHISNRTSKPTQDDTITVVQDVLLKNMDTSYPATPREVLKYYNQVTQCFYNETYSDEEFQKLAERAESMYDQELLDNQTDTQYKANLEAEVSHYKEAGIVVSSTAIASSTDVDYYSYEGRECANVRCVYTMREGTSLSVVKEVYVLRKDTTGHWKILGWDTYDDSEETK